MRDSGLLGWSTLLLVKLDDETPGVFARVLTAAPSRRQAIFSALAAWEEKAGVFDASGDDLFPIPFAEIVRHGRAADILRHAFGDVPQGFPGALARIGERPLDRAEDYIRLHALLAAGHPSIVETLLSCPRIASSILRVLTALDPRWVHINTVSRLDKPTEATAFNEAVAFIQSVSSRLTDEAVAASIARMAPTTSLAHLLDRLMRRADRLPTHPIREASNELRPLTSIRDHIEIAHRYRNCLTHRIGDVAAGRIAVAEFREECLLEFRPLTLDAGWMLWAVHGPRNDPVNTALADAAAVVCDAQGIPHLDETRGARGWRSYRSLTRELEWCWGD